MKILDATCGFRGMWYQKNHPFVTFMDKRCCVAKSSKNTKPKNRRTWKIAPDIVAKWEDAPFSDNYFDVIIFDPPHLIINRNTKTKSNMMQAYGYLYKDNYEDVLEKAFEKLFRILKKDGLFILKWCESCVKLQDIFKLIPYKPLFGTNTRSKQFTANFWVVFIKDDTSKLED